MADKKVQLVFSNAADGKDDEFNKWYDEVHLPEVLAVPGMVSAQRYDLIDAEMTQSMPLEHRYLTIYEMEGDVDAIMGEVRDRVAAGSVFMSDAIDLSNPLLSFWSPRAPKVEASS